MSLKPRLDEALVQKIKELIERFPTYGYRRIWVWLRDKFGITVSKKKVYRIMKLKGWMVRARTHRGLVSRSAVVGHSGAISAGRWT